MNKIQHAVNTEVEKDAFWGQPLVGKVTGFVANQWNNAVKPGGWGANLMKNMSQKWNTGSAFAKNTFNNGSSVAKASWTGAKNRLSEIKKPPEFSI